MKIEVTPIEFFAIGQALITRQHELEKASKEKGWAGELALSELEQARSAYDSICRQYYAIYAEARKAIEESNNQ